MLYSKVYKSVIYAELANIIIENLALQRELYRQVIDAHRLEQLERKLIFLALPIQTTLEICNFIAHYIPRTC